MPETPQRSTQQVISNHLRLRSEGRTREDLQKNYAEDVIVLSHLGHFRGREAVGTLAALLDQQLKDAQFHFATVLVDHPYAFVHWTAEAKDLRVSDGVDSFVLEGGRIKLQTIYYSISTRQGAVNAPTDVPG